jgi:hypothetical protein
MHVKIMETGRQTYRVERVALALLANAIVRPRITGDAQVDAVPEAIRLFPHLCSEPHPHALEAAARMQCAREMLLRGDRPGARRLLCTLALTYLRYARIFRAVGRADLTRSFEYLGEHLTEATRVLGADAAPDAWLPALDEQSLDVGDGRAAIAQRRIEVTLDGEPHLALLVRVTVLANTPPDFRLEVYINAPDPARTQVAFEVVVNDRDEALSVARRWGAIGAAMVKAAVDPHVLLACPS